jgi:hypothetical protein
VNASRKVDFYSIAQLLLGGLGLLILLPTVVFSAGFGLISAISKTGESGESFTLLAMAWTGGLLVLLILPMIINVILRLLDKPAHPFWPPQSRKVATIALLVWPLLFWLGTSLAKQADLAWIFLPPLQVVLIAIPLWWLVEMSMYLLQIPRTTRTWPVISFSLLVTPVVLVIMEILFVVLALAGFIVWAVGQPAVLADLEQLSLRLMNAPGDPEIIMRIMQPYLQNPAVISIVLGMAAGVIPLLEEIFKPMAVWLLIPRKLSPREGFAMGMLSGAIFGLVESLSVLFTPLGGSWAGVMIGRLGTGLLHTLTAALVGWGIASAWTQRRVLRLFLSYLAAVILHTVWNTFALLLGFSALIETAAADGISGLYVSLAHFSPFVLAALAAYMLFMLLMRSRSIGRQESQLAEAAQHNSTMDTGRIEP